MSGQDPSWVDRHVVAPDGVNCEPLSPARPPRSSHLTRPTRTRAQAVFAWVEVFLVLAALVAFVLFAAHWFGNL